ncbi:MAG: hypothetical protein ACYCW6_31430 [Candidatus Xenobia bacterium]
MKRWLVLTLLLWTMGWPAHAQEGGEHVDPGEQHERLEVYYNRSFFNEPWRRADAPQQVRHEAVEVAIAAGAALGALLKLRRSG